MKSFFASLLLLIPLAALGGSPDTNLFQSTFGTSFDIYANPFTGTPSGQPVNGVDLTNVNASKLGGFPASDFILSGGDMDFDGGTITSDGNGQMTFSRQGDSLTVTETAGVWKFSYNGGSFAFFPDGSIGCDASVGTFFQAGGDSIPAMGNDNGPNARTNNVTTQ